MQLNNRDRNREKKVDWDKGGFLKDPGHRAPSLKRILGLVVLFIFAAAFAFLWGDIISRGLTPKPAPQPPIHYVEKIYVPVPQQQPPQPYQPTEPPIHAAGLFPLKKIQSASEVVEAPQEKTYAGYAEVNGKRIEIYNPPAAATTFTYQTKGNNLKYITVEIDNQFIEFIIDTGASDVALNAQTVRQLGIRNFTGRSIHGTAGGPTEAYLFVIPSMKLGRFEVKNVKASYSPRNPYNLLGNSFLSHFNVMFNESKGEMTLTQK